MWKPSRLYSQNYEDLYLFRLFSGLERGFYVDVGAWRPFTHNVTAIFYEQGWTGINIEPLKEAFDELRSARPNDLNLCLATTDSMENDCLYLSVIGDAPLDYGHHRICNELSNDPIELVDLHGSVRKRAVPASTLRHVLESYAPCERINFLKIDVEGFEFRTLLGLDLPSLSASLRPEVIVLEATLPNTRISAPYRSQCARILHANRYRHLFFDGLNDYYCEQFLYSRFRPLMLPPNVFDLISLDPCSAFDDKQASATIVAEVEELQNVLRECRMVADDHATDIAGLRVECNRLREALAHAERELEAKDFALETTTSDLRECKVELRESGLNAKFLMAKLDALAKSMARVRSLL